MPVWSESKGHNVTQGAESVQQVWRHKPKTNAPSQCFGTDWLGGVVGWPLTFLTQRNVVVLVRVLFQPPRGAPAEHQMNANTESSWGASPLPSHLKENVLFHLPNPFLFCSLSSDFSKQKVSTGLRVGLLLSAWSAFSTRHLNVSAGPTLLADLRCGTRHLRQTTDQKINLLHSSNKSLFLLVQCPDLRDACIFRQPESLALEEVTSSRGRLADERARQTITGQVCPLYPPRAG